MTHNTDNVNDILKQRAVHYGRYDSGIKCRAAILNALNNKYKETHNNEDMPFDLLVMFSDINLKLMRIVSDPTHKDSYIDLEGYAKLIKEMQIEAIDKSLKGKL